jgi:hypothetical protein
MLNLFDSQRRNEQQQAQQRTVSVSETKQFAPQLVLQVGPES